MTIKEVLERLKSIDSELKIVNERLESIQHRLILACQAKSYETNSMLDSINKLDSLIDKNDLDLYATPKSKLKAFQL